MIFFYFFFFFFFLAAAAGASSLDGIHCARGLRTLGGRSAGYIARELELRMKKRTKGKKKFNPEKTSPREGRAS